MLKHFLTVLAVLAVATTSWAERVDMIKAGAKIDGKTINTKLINQTIERLNKQGGGTLFFPSGTYLTGPIHMKSNITLELEAGATLLFSTNFDDYLPFVEVRHEGVMMKSFSPLIYAVDAENITIKGEGTIDGQGKAWWDEFFTESVTSINTSPCLKKKMMWLKLLRKQMKTGTELLTDVFSAHRLYSPYAARMCV